MEAAQKPKRGLAIASCVLGILSIPTLGLAFVGALASVILGVTALVKHGRNPKEYGGRTPAIVGIVAAALSIVVMPVLAGIVAAIAIPSLLRARVVANEAAVVKDISTLVLAESSYSRQNCGFFDRVECLERPQECRKGTGFSPFVAVIPAAHAGYVRTFHAGEAASQEDTQSRHLSPTSIRSFALTAVPIQRGQTGVRSFCGDAKGRLCLLGDGTEPAVVDGDCQIARAASVHSWALCEPQADARPEK
jgi:hypothetical protein